MDRKNYLFYITVISLCSVLISVQDAGHLRSQFLITSSIACTVALVPGFLTFKGRLRNLRIVLLFLVITGLIHIHFRSTVNLGLSRETVCEIEGIVVYDSSFSQSGNHLMTVNLKSAKNCYGTVSSASGLVTVVGKEKAIITSFSKVRLKGAFSNDMFIYDSLEVSDRSLFSRFREEVINAVERRTNCSESEPALLSLMLLLGRSEDYSIAVKTLAQGCGCSHVLALSGMHLNIIAGLIKIPHCRKLSRVLSSIAVILFVAIAGPRPSLVRAALMYLLFFLNPFEKTLACLFIQMIFLPLTLVNTGSVYGYLAVFALIYLSPYVSYFLKPFCPFFITSVLSTGLPVLLFTAPLQMITGTYWYPVSILAGPVLGFLAGMSMVCGLALVAFGHLSLIVKINEAVYRAFVLVLEKACLFPKAGLVSYIILVLVFVFAIAAVENGRLKTLKFSLCGNLTTQAQNRFPQ